MPGTAAGLGVTNVLDPAQSLDGGAKYLSSSSTPSAATSTRALAAYNAGPGAVQRFGGVPPYAETQNYVRIVQANAAQYRAAGAAPSILLMNTDRTQPAAPRRADRPLLGRPGRAPARGRLRRAARGAVAPAHAPRREEPQPRRDERARPRPGAARRRAAPRAARRARPPQADAGTRRRSRRPVAPSPPRWPSPSRRRSPCRSRPPLRRRPLPRSPTAPLFMLAPEAVGRRRSAGAAARRRRAVPAEAAAPAATAPGRPAPRSCAPAARLSPPRRRPPSRRRSRPAAAGRRRRARRAGSGAAAAAAPRGRARPPSRRSGRRGAGRAGDPGRARGSRAGARRAAATAEPAPAAAPAAQAPATEPVAPAPISAPASGLAAPERAVPLHRAPAAVATLLHVAAERGITHARLNLQARRARRHRGAPAVHAAAASPPSWSPTRPRPRRLLAQAGDDLRRALEARDVTLLSLDVSTSGDQQQQSARGEWTRRRRRRPGRRARPRGPATPTATPSPPRPPRPSSSSPMGCSSTSSPDPRTGR